MPYITEQQNSERETLEAAISTVTKVDPRQFANLIHNSVVVRIHEQGLTVDETLEQMKDMLASYDIQHCAGGNNFDGWKDRKARLSPKQQATIHGMLTLMLRMGGTFSPYED